MKILFLSKLYKPHIGGVEKQVEELSKRLLKKGFDVSIITEKFERNLKDKEIVDGVKVIRFWYPHVKFLGLFYIWLWLLKNNCIIRQADIVHDHGVFIWYWPFRLLFPKKPIYTTFHGWEGIYPIPFKNILLRKIASKLAWKNICIGGFIEKHYGIKADEIIYTSVDAPTNKQFQKDWHNLVYIGRLDEDTGLRLILKALLYIRGFKIEFCGDGPLRSECQKYGEVHGFIDPRRYLKKAAICLSPGITSILEAFTYRCLIITTYNNPVKKDYLLMNPFSKWIVVEKFPKKMAQKICYYSKFPKKADPLIEKSYNWVLTQNWENATKIYLNLWGLE